MPHSSPLNAVKPPQQLGVTSLFSSNTLGCPRTAAAALKAHSCTARGTGGIALVCKFLDALGARYNLVCSHLLVVPG